MDRVGTAKGGGRHFRQANRADLACLLGTHQGPDRVLYRHLSVQTVHVIEVDMIGIKPDQRLIQRLGDGVGMAVQDPLTVLHIEHALAGQNKLFTAMHDRLGHQSFIVALAIDGGRIEEGHARIQRMLQQLDTVGLRRRGPIGVVEVHTAQTNGRNR